MAPRIFERGVRASGAAEKHHRDICTAGMPFGAKKLAARPSLNGGRGGVGNNFHDSAQSAMCYMINFYPDLRGNSFIMRDKTFTTLGY